MKVQEIKMNKILEYVKVESQTCSPPGMHKRDCAFLSYLQTGYAVLLTRSE